MQQKDNSYEQQTHHQHWYRATVRKGKETEREREREREREGGREREREGGRERERERERERGRERERVICMQKQCGECTFVFPVNHLQSRTSTYYQHWRLPDEHVSH